MADEARQEHLQAGQYRQEPKQKEKSVRLQKREARLKAVREAAQTRNVRVVPRDDDIRRALRHPRGGGFRAKGSSEWPLDNFTRRRIRDGSVTVEERGEQRTADQRAQAMRHARQGVQRPEGAGQ